MYKVYLAGPITGLDYDDAIDWRDDVKQELWEKSNGTILGVSPMRAKEHLKNHVLNETHWDGLLTTPKGIVARDRNDVKTADLVLFNMLCATKTSIGTCVEFGWADAFGIPSVLVMEDPGITLPNRHEHSFVRTLTDIHTTNLDDAVDCILRWFPKVPKNRKKFLTTLY